jgi:hypothetical protein
MQPEAERRIEQMLAHLRRFEAMTPRPEQAPIVAVAIAAIEEELRCLGRLAAARRLRPAHATAGA